MALFAFPEAYEYLLNRNGIKLGLGNTRRLLAGLGDPHRQFAAIHVAGTNGKGSVCAFLEAALRGGGFRTGLNTSPHLVSVRERVRVDGHAIGDEDFVRRLEEIIAANHLDRRLESPPAFLDADASWDQATPAPPPDPDAPVNPSFFEMMTVLAFHHFARGGVELAVVEVGLGGRLDATNVLTPEVSVITSIELDHTKTLGGTLREIAGEKAGIIKPGVPVVCSETKPEPLARIQEVAAEREAPLWLAGRDFEILAEEHRRHGDWARLHSRIRVGERTFAAESGLLGPHQSHNLATALATLCALEARGWSWSWPELLTGLGAAAWPARLQRLPDGLILDGGHNVSGLAASLATLRELFPGRRYHCLFGVMRDKDWRRMVAMLADCCDRLYLPPVANHRAEPPESIAAYAREAFPQLAPEVVPDIATGLARLRAAPSGLVLGSLYLAGEVLDCYTHGEPAEALGPAPALAAD